MGFVKTKYRTTHVCKKKYLNHDHQYVFGIYILRHKKAAILAMICGPICTVQELSWKGDEIFILELSKRKNISNALS